MGIISYIDDNFQLVDCFRKRDYKELEEIINKTKDHLTVYQEFDDSLFGFNITKNQPLSELFEDEFYVVRMICSNVDTLHNNKQLDIMKNVFLKLNNIINSRKGYYNLRLPTHIVDALKAYNCTIPNGIFCGGTIEEMIYGKQVNINIKDGLDVFFASKKYIEKNKKLLMQMTYKSFESYQGQYHISSITESKAGIIYENWIQDSLEHCENNIVVSEYAGEPIGFVTILEKENAVEGILSAVDSKYRKLGAYRTMISYIVNYAFKHDKSFITSTQFDNFIVQGVWNSIGLKPFYSIYNIHIDKRI